MTTHERNLVMVYMYKELNYKPSELSKIFGLANSTIRNYIWQYCYGKNDKEYKNMLFNGQLLFCRYFREKSQIAEMRYDIALANSGLFLPNPCSYILLLKEEIVMTKVGMTTNLVRRLKQLKKQYGNNIEILAIFNFENVEDAYLMETLLHKFYKKKGKGEFIPQDRFIGNVFHEKDLSTLFKVADELRNKEWF